MDRGEDNSVESSPTIILDTSEANLAKAKAEFITILGDEYVTSDITQCKSHSGSPWYPAKEHERPTIVVQPAGTQHVSEILKVCSTRQIPVYAYSGGTGLHGATIATRGGVCIDLSRMDEILELHQEDRDIVVQPAIGWQELNEYLAKYGLFLPPDPAPGAKIGGMVAMNCSGTNAYRYGTMRDWVLSVTIVLASGKIIKTRNRPRKSSAGYDLTNLIVGSEGTLGVVTEAILKVTNLPTNPHVGIASFPSTKLAVQASIEIINAGQLDALEFIDEHSMRALNRSKLSKITWDETASLFMKLSGSADTVKGLSSLVESIAQRNECLQVKISAKEEDTSEWWHARKMMGRALVGMKSSPTDLFLSADAAVPRSKLTESINETHRVSKDLGFFCSTIGHIGDGNVHTAIVCTPEQEAEGKKMIRFVQELALRLDGTVTGEHGIGTSLREMLVEEIGSDGVDTIRKIKLALDPKGVLNPDKVVRMNYQI